MHGDDLFGWVVNAENHRSLKMRRTAEGLFRIDAPGGLRFASPLASDSLLVFNVKDALDRLRNVYLERVA